jgi:chromosome segregation ATPase
MEVAQKAVESVDLRILQPENIQAVEQSAAELRAQLHMQETAVSDGEAACGMIQSHTQAMRLAGKTAEVGRVELEKDIVEWHLHESEESEARTRRWLEKALQKTETVIATQAEEIVRLKEMHRADTEELQTKLTLAQNELASTLQSNEIMEAECAKTCRRLREEVSSEKFDKESVQTKLEQEQGANQLMREQLEATQAQLDTKTEQVAELTILREEALDDAAQSRKTMADTVQQKQRDKVARCEQVQRDKVRMESNLRQEVAMLKKTNARLLQEKVETAARLAMSEKEAAGTISGLKNVTDKNTSLREVVESLEIEVARLKQDNNRLSHELSVASDDVLNLRCELGGTRRKYEAATRQCEELKATQHEPADYRMYQPGYAYDPKTVV